MSFGIPVLELTGTPYEMGVAHGETLRTSIRDFVASITRVHQENNTHLKVDDATLKAFCMRNIGFVQKFSPDLLDEMRGIADGAGMGLEDIVYLNTFLELEDLRAPGVGGRILPDALWGCTTFNVTAEATADGAAYIGQTYDMERYYEKYLALLRIKPSEGPEALVVTMSGLLGMNGMNTAGVGAVINKIVAPDARPGVIYPCVMRKALAAERIGDALGAVIYTSRATGMNYQLAGNGVHFCAEVSATSYDLLPVDKALAHTNHYLSPTMRRFETPNWLSHGGTMVRKQVADNFLRRNTGKLTPELLQEMTKDHTNYPRCICAHGFPEEGENTAFETIFAVIMQPEAGWMQLCVGNPCENEYQTFSLQAS